MTVGQRIKYIREKKQMSQTELADKINVTKQNLYKYESGIITNIPSDKIEQIAKIFNVSPAYIMGWDIELADESILCDREAALVNKYRGLNDIGKLKIDDYINDLIESPKYQHRDPIDIALEKVLKRQESPDYFEIAAHGGRGVEAGESKFDEETFNRIIRKHDE